MLYRLAEWVACAFAQHWMCVLWTLTDYISNDGLVYIYYAVAQWSASNKNKKHLATNKNIHLAELNAS